MKTVLIIVLLSLVAIGSAIKCYHCANCKDSKGDLMTCPTVSDACQSITTEGVTAKSCSIKATCEAACDAAKKAGTGECSCCDTDGCNGGVSARISTLAILVPIAAALKFFF